MNDCQKGSSMIEILSVIAIIGILGISGLKLIAGLYERYKVSVVVDEIKSLQKNITSRYGVVGHYADLTEAKLISEKVVPAVMVSGGKLIHNTGGVVKIEVNENDDLFYDVTFDSLSRNACLEMGNINWMINQSSNLDVLNINGYEFFWPCSKPDQTKCPASSVKKADNNALPAKPVVVSQNCMAGSNNVIRWTFQ